MSSSPGAIGSGVRTTAFRPMVSPFQGGKRPLTAIARRVRKSFVRGTASVDIDRLPRDQDHALCLAENRNPADAHRAPVIAKDVERRLPKLFPSLEARARLLARGARSAR